MCKAMAIGTGAGLASIKQKLRIHMFGDKRILSLLSIVLQCTLFTSRKNTRTLLLTIVLDVGCLCITDAFQIQMGSCPKKREKTLKSRILIYSKQGIGYSFYFIHRY